MTSDTPSQAERAGSEQSALDIAMDALFDVRRAIFNADPNVLTDTLWMPGDTYRGGTVVDFIENEMERVRNARASSAGLGEMIYRALYEPAGGLWSAVDDRYKETVWNAAGHRLAAMLAASPASPPAEALPSQTSVAEVVATVENKGPGPVDVRFTEARPDHAANRGRLRVHDVAPVANDEGDHDGGSRDRGSHR